METKKIAGNQRLEFLDALRGVAITLVILFHAYIRWPRMYPEGSPLAGFYPAVYGMVGVQLFFLISGFVILMTLEHTASFSTFMYKRWLRLFPAMLICSLIIFVSAPLLPERPEGLPSRWHLLSGLTFIEPSTWKQILHFYPSMIEGSFWSLFVEAKFYIIFGIFYYLLGAKAATYSIAAISIFEKLLSRISTIPLLVHCQPYHWIIESLHFMSVSHFCWFASGAFFYEYYQCKTRWSLVAALTCGTLGICQVYQDFTQSPGRALAAFTVLPLFAMALLSTRLQNLLSNKFLLFMGFISYPLYLIHENMMVALSLKVRHSWTSTPAILAPILPILAITLLAWFIAQYIEPATRAFLSKCINKCRVSIAGVLLPKP